MIKGTWNENEIESWVTVQSARENSSNEDELLGEEKMALIKEYQQFILEMPNEIKKVNEHKKTIQDQMDKNRINYYNILEYQPKLDVMMK